MLPLFPRIFPDELFYSACARYHRIVNNDSIRKTSLDLFGQNIKVLSWDFPHHLSYFSEQLPKKGCLPVYDLVENNTMVPLYRPFLGEEKINKLIDGMLSQVSCSSINRMKVGNVSEKTPKLRSLRCCLDCMVEDKREYNDCFWHRSHQAHGVYVCHKHGKVLWNTKAFLDFRPGFKVLFPLEDALLDSPVTDVEISTNEMQELKWIADSVHHLLNKRVYNHNNLDLYEIYRKILSITNFSKNNVVKYLAVKDYIIKKYGMKLLGMFFLDPGKEIRKMWIYKILNGQRLYKNLLCHFLFINAFNIDLDGLFSGSVADSLLEKLEFKPFGDGPWPCLNPVCVNYRKNVVADCKVYKKRGKIFGRFTCKCGFIYSRVGPDKSKNDRFKKSSILQIPKELNDEMFRLVNDEGLSFTDVSMKLDVPRTTVRRTVEEGKSNKSCHEKSIVANEIIKQKRNEWLRLMQENPSLSRTYLRNKFRNKFNWLERNDKVWLYDNLPSKAKKGSDFDWGKLDEEIAPKIYGIAEQIKNMRNPFVRVTPTAIFHTLGRRKYLKTSKFLEKVPRIKIELIKVVESIEEFRIRRLKIVAEQLNSQGSFCKTQLLIKAGIIEKECTARVIEEINRLIAKY